MEDDIDAAVIDSAERWAAALEQTIDPLGGEPSEEAQEALMSAVAALLDAVHNRQAAQTRRPVAGSRNRPSDLN